MLQAQINSAPRTMFHLGLRGASDEDKHSRAPCVGSAAGLACGAIATDHVAHNRDHSQSGAVLDRQCFRLRKFSGCACYRAVPIWSSDQALSAPPYQFTIQVPNAISPGQYMLTAVGNTASGPGTYSTPIFVDVERPDSPVSINVEPTIFKLYPGQMGYLRVIGTFADGSSLDLTKSTTTTFSSSVNAVATVNAQGIVTPLGRIY